MSLQTKARQACSKDCFLLSLGLEFKSCTLDTPHACFCQLIQLVWVSPGMVYNMMVTVTNRDLVTLPHHRSTLTLRVRGT